MGMVSPSIETARSQEHRNGNTDIEKGSLFQKALRTLDQGRHPRQWPQQTIVLQAAHHIVFLLLLLFYFNLPFQKKWKKDARLGHCLCTFFSRTGTSSVNKANGERQCFNVN
jgi:hypothetical protein